MEIYPKLILSTAMPNSVLKMSTERQNTMRTVLIWAALFLLFVHKIKKIDKYLSVGHNVFV